MNEPLGRMLKQSREEMGLTQDALAAVSGISQPTLSKYESGSITPSPATLAKLCSSLEMPFDQLIRMTL
jgi:transcriptional regulator with XRE-family HTH domain